jgi:hypothetical protein
LRIFEFRGDRIAALFDAQQSPVMGPDYYDWRVEDEILVLTRYEKRDVNESAMRKVRRTAFAVGEMLQGQPVRGESIEKYKIFHSDPNTVHLTYPRRDNSIAVAPSRSFAPAKPARTN